MNDETNAYKQILTFLETLQEFVDTNPNEVTVLADSALLIQAIRADLNPQDVAIRDKTGADARILRLLDTMQEFIDTYPNELLPDEDREAEILRLFQEIAHLKADRESIVLSADFLYELISISADADMIFIDCGRLRLQRAALAAIELWSEQAAHKVRPADSWLKA
jgi:hypothetical protein